MISRTGLITTALLLCQLLLRPGVLTIQLHAAQVQQSQASGGSESQSEAPAPSMQKEKSAAASSGQQPAAPVSVTDDAGQEDVQTEKLIQQEIDSGSGQELGPQRPASNVPLGHNEVLISADEQEKNQDMYHVRGHVVIRFGNNVLHADQATYDSSTGIITANGHVVYDGGLRNEHVVATRATYDISRDTGKFYDAVGSSGARVKNRTMYLTSSTPFFFTGKVVDKLGPDRYRVHNGYVTSCQLPKPKWVFASKTANIELGDDAVMYHATLKLAGIPVFYFPVAEHPVDNLGRKSGILTPEIGLSTSRGTTLGDGFYWAISRNADATIGAELFSKRGPAETADFRYLGFNSLMNVQFFAVQDLKGYQGQHQGGQEIRINAWKQLPDDFQAVLSVDQLSSWLFRLAFAQAFTEAISSEARSTGFITKNWDDYTIGLMASSYQNYESTSPGDYIQIVHSPSLEFSTVERSFNRSDFVYSYDAAAEGVSRNEIGFETAPIVGRADASAHVSLPKVFNGWTFRPEVGLRETYYTERLEPAANTEIGIAVHDPINRNVANASFEVRPPALGKIFDEKLHGRVLKHTIEPYAVYRYQTGIENFSQIIRFDGRDILADTSEVEYGVTNRVFVKKSTLSPKCFQQKDRAAQKKLQETAAAQKACKDEGPPSGNVISWDLAQKYFANTTFGGALVPGTRNVFDTTEQLTGIDFLTEPRRFSPVISRLRAQAYGFDFQWALDYDPVLHQVNASTVFAGYIWKSWFLNGGHTYLNAPGDEAATTSGTTTPTIFNQWRVGAIYGGMNRLGFSGGVGLAFDSELHLAQAVAAQTNYNWDCCGIAFQYARWAFGTIRDENSYRFSFSLTNVGSFGSLKRIERMY